MSADETQPSPSQSGDVSVAEAPLCFLCGKPVRFGVDDPVGPKPWPARDDGGQVVTQIRGVRGPFDEPQLVPGRAFAFHTVACVEGEGWITKPAAAASAVNALRAEREAHPLKRVTPEAVDLFDDLGRRLAVACRHVRDQALGGSHDFTLAGGRASLERLQSAALKTGGTLVHDMVLRVVAAVLEAAKP